MTTTIVIIIIIIIIYKKFSCRRETARCFMSLNISLRHSRSLKIIDNGTICTIGYGFLFAFHSNYSSVLYHFRDRATYLSKIAIFFRATCIRRPRKGSSWNIAMPFGVKKTRMVWLPDGEKV